MVFDVALLLWLHLQLEIIVASYLHETLICLLCDYKGIVTIYYHMSNDACFFNHMIYLKWLLQWNNLKTQALATLPKKLILGY
jgi:hypothetical protein